MSEPQGTGVVFDINKPIEAQLIASCQLPVLDILFLQGIDDFCAHAMKRLNIIGLLACFQSIHLPQKIINPTKVFDGRSLQYRDRCQAPITLAAEVEDGVQLVQVNLCLGEVVDSDLLQVSDISQGVQAGNTSIAVVREMGIGVA